MFAEGEHFTSQPPFERNRPSDGTFHSAKREFHLSAVVSTIYRSDRGAGINCKLQIPNEMHARGASARDQRSLYCHSEHICESKTPLPRVEESYNGKLCTLSDRGAEVILRIDIRLCAPRISRCPLTAKRQETPFRKLLLFSAHKKGVKKSR